jgi:fumarate reductase flavoprotein subunit
MQWLENKGLVFDAVHRFGREYPRGYHTFRQAKDKKFVGAGARIIETLTNDCKRLGVTILTKATGKRILTDKKGKVTGIVAVKEGEEIKITAKAVIIAAGGFPGNREMMAKYLPAKGFRLSLSLPHKGEGILMAEKAGAIIDDCVTTFFIGPHHYPYTQSLTSLLRRPEMLVVNKRGERFSDESLWLSHQHQTGHPLVRQPDEICYGLIDSGALRDMIKRRETFGGMDEIAGVDWLDQVYDDFKTDVTKKVAKIASTWDEIAEFMGAKPEMLKATVEQYNSCCDNGYDYDMLKDTRFLFPLRTPPFYAILGRNGFDATFGGIKINERMEVINKKYEPISGLYAVGNNAGSAINVNYHPMHAGTSMSFAVCSGYIAGKNAAKFILGK